MKWLFVLQLLHYLSKMYGTVNTLILVGLCIFIFILKWERILLFPSPTVSRVPCVYFAAVDLWGVKSAYLGVPASKLLLETKTLILEKLSACAIWFCLFNCATSSERHHKWPSTYLSHSTLFFCCGGLRHRKAGWHGCVGFRCVVLESREVGKMRNKDQEQWSRKIRRSNSFCWRLSDF